MSAEAPPPSLLCMEPSFFPASSSSALSCLGSEPLLPPGSHRPHKLIRHLLESSAHSRVGRVMAGILVRDDDNILRKRLREFKTLSLSDRRKQDTFQISKRLYIVRICGVFWLLYQQGHVLPLLSLELKRLL